jgi:hypothetical protein
MHFQASDQEKLEVGFGGYTCKWGLDICGLMEIRSGIYFKITSL